MSEVIKYAAAVIVGLLLFAAPFLLYGFGGAHAHAAHSDHGPRHGGHLFMLGDHHLEFVEEGDLVELYLSDSKRRPLRPMGCEVTVGDGDTRSCAWQSYRSVARLQGAGAGAVYRLTVGDGTELSLQYPSRPLVD